MEKRIFSVILTIVFVALLNVLVVLAGEKERLAFASDSTEVYFAEKGERDYVTEEEERIACFNSGEEYPVDFYLVGYQRINLLYYVLVYQSDKTIVCLNDNPEIWNKTVYKKGEKILASQVVLIPIAFLSMIVANVLRTKGKFNESSLIGVGAIFAIALTIFLTSFFGSPALLVVLLISVITGLFLVVSNMEKKRIKKRTYVFTVAIFYIATIASLFV